MDTNFFLQNLRKEVLELLENEPVKVALFGSRGRGDSSVTSDVDLAIIPYGKYDKRKLISLREKIEEMNIPYRVDVVNFEDVSDAFKQEALKGSLTWKD